MKYVLNIALVAVGAGLIVYALGTFGGTGAPGGEEAQQGRITSISALRPPPPGAPEEDKQRHFDIVISEAVASDTLIVSDCSFSPEVLRLALDATVTVVNEDDVEHAMVFDRAFSLKIPAGKRTTLRGETLPHGPGVYGYACDTNTSPNGMIHVPPAEPAP